MLTYFMNDHGLEPLVHFPTREKKNTLDLLLTSLPGNFRIFTHRTNSAIMILLWNFESCHSPIKKHRRKMYLYQKGDYESMRKDAFEFAKEKYFNGYPDTHSVQENFNLIASFIQVSADKHIQSKTNRTISLVPWIRPKRYLCFR